MSFCSYEEAWGSPYESNSEHVTKPMNKENDIRQVKKMVIESRESRKATNDVAPAAKVETSDFNAGMVETAPLRGSLLGGAIPDEQWTASSTNPEHYHQNNMFANFEKKFDDKIDKLVDSIDKLTRGYNSGFTQNSTTSWADVLIFIALGIASIFILDMFFKFGKWMVQTKLEMNRQSQIFDSMPSSPSIPQPVPPSRYSYTPRPKMSPPPMYGGANYHSPYRMSGGGLYH